MNAFSTEMFTYLPQILIFLLVVGLILFLINAYIKSKAYLDDDGEQVNSEEFFESDLENLAVEVQTSELFHPEITLTIKMPIKTGYVVAHISSSWPRSEPETFQKISGYKIIYHFFVPQPNGGYRKSQPRQIITLFPDGKCVLGQWPDKNKQLLATKKNGVIRLALTKIKK